MRLVLFIEVNRFGGKDLLILRSGYAIWKKCCDFVNLFGVANLVAGDEIEPIVNGEHAEKRMRKTVSGEILGFCFVKRGPTQRERLAKIKKSRFST